MFEHQKPEALPPRRDTTIEQALRLRDAPRLAPGEEEGVALLVEVFRLRAAALRRIAGRRPAEGRAEVVQVLYDAADAV